MSEEGKNKETMTRKMGGMCLVLVVLCAVGVVWGLIKIQIIDGDYWRECSKSRKLSEQRDPAQRGIIYSTDGRTLATAVPVCNLYMDLGHRKVRKSDGTYDKDRKGNIRIDTAITRAAYDTNLATICSILHKWVPDKSAEYYKQKIDGERSKNTPNQCFLVERNIPYACWLELRRVDGWHRGILETVDERNVKHYIRVRTYGNMAGNVIGFENGNTDTYTGLEGYYDSILRGRDGLYMCRRLTKGVWLADEDYNDIDSIRTQSKVDGSDIVSTIDSRYQDIAESALRDALLKNNGTSGCAILMEVETGYVLACSNLSRDTGTAGSYIEIANTNIACADLYEPGSAFKPVILTAMVADKAFVLDTNKKVRARVKKFDESGYCEICDEHGDKDTISLMEVIVQSSNVGMAELGWANYRKKRNDLKTAMQNVFPTKALMLDLNTSEYNQRISDLRPNRNFLNFCFGYSTTVSPMQLLTFYNAIANDGKMMKPLFCRQIGTGKTAETIVPVVLKESICSKETAKTIREMLLQVVERGTATTIKNNHYGIAGKTGTAKIIPQGVSPNNSTFVCCFPAEKPQYCCLVLIKNTYASGGKAAAPAAKRIADAVMALDSKMGSVKMERLQWSTSDEQRNPQVSRGYRSEIMQAYETVGATYTDCDSVGEWVYRSDRLHRYSPTTSMVPEVRGMTAKDAIRALDRAGLKYTITGCGKVESQTPKARTRVKKGTKVGLSCKNR